jgi:hypothetical protein
LGIFYKEGLEDLIEEDSEKALDYFEKGKNVKDSSSMYNYACMKKD